MAIAELESSIEQEQSEPSDEEFIKDLTTRLLERVKVFEDAHKPTSNAVANTPIFDRPKRGNTNTMEFGGNMPKQSGLDANADLKFELNALNVKTDPPSENDYYFLEMVMHFLVDRFKEDWSVEQSKLQEIKQRSIQRN